MQQSYQDAKAIVWKYIKPDLFLIYICNPKCPEITDRNRLDLVERVYKSHLNEVMLDITDRHIYVLGMHAARVHII